MLYYISDDSISHIYVSMCFPNSTSRAHRGHNTSKHNSPVIIEVLFLHLLFLGHTPMRGLIQYIVQQTPELMRSQSQLTFVNTLHTIHLTIDTVLPHTCRYTDHAQVAVLHGLPPCTALPEDGLVQTRPQKIQHCTWTNPTNTDKRIKVSLFP